MKIFKILLGLIIMVTGLGMAAAGIALFAYGNYGNLLNTFFGFTLVFLGLGAIASGLYLLRGDSVREVLGGIVTARSGHSGIGLHNGGVNDLPPVGFKETVLVIIRYVAITIAVILIAIFSVFRVIGGFHG